MKKTAVVIFLCFRQILGFTQPVSTENMRVLLEAETGLMQHAEGIIDGTEPEIRAREDSIFTRNLVTALKVPYSFYYPFDSLYTISRLYAPDSTFRIITWQLELSSGYYRQHGAIQMRTTDGRLKLFPLIDRSETVEKYQDTIADNLGWIGAVYYNIISKEYNGKTIYTLLGFDENSVLSSRKIIEILDMSGGTPVFGKKIFTPRGHARYVMEFKKGAAPRLNYDPELDLISMEHLVSQSNEPNRKFTLIGDGDYDGFRWMDGRWIFVEKLFADVPPPREIPVPVPFTENKLNFTEPENPKPEKSQGKGRSGKKSD